MWPADGKPRMAPRAMFIALLASLASVAGGDAPPHFLYKRIIQGTMVSPGFKYPWVASLFVAPTIGSDDYLFSCGGTLLNEEWVLTAGQCCFTSTAGTGGPNDWKRTRVETGRFNLSKTVLEENKGQYPVEHQATYPQFLPTGGPLFNDVGVWRLHGRAIGPATVALDASDNLTSAGTVAVMAGWGARNGTSSTSPFLAAARLSILSNDDCKDRLPDTDEGPVFDGARQICAAGQQKEIGISRGDAGSPLFVYVRTGKTRMPVIVGIASQAVERSGVRYSIFTRVSHYTTWITNEIGNNTDGLPKLWGQ